MTDHSDNASVRNAEGRYENDRRLPVSNKLAWSSALLVLVSAVNVAISDSTPKTVVFIGLGLIGLVYVVSALREVHRRRNVRVAGWDHS